MARFFVGAYLSANRGSKSFAVETAPTGARK